MAKKITRFVSSFLMIIMLFSVSSVFFSTYAEENNRFAEIIAQYNNPNGRLLCAAHKGDVKNFPENSLEGIVSSIQMGVDIVEVDLSRTMDGYFVLLEGNNLSRTCVDQNGTTVEGLASEKRLDEISTYRLRNQYGGVAAAITDYYVTTLDQALLVCKGRVLLMLDNAWAHRDEIYDILRAKGMLDSVIIKANAPSKEVGEWIASKPQIPLTCGYYDGNLLFNIKRYIKSSANNGTRVVQLATENQNGAMFDKAVVKIFKDARGYINTAEPNFCANRQDNLIAWGEALEKGYSIIETTEPQLLIEYRKRIETAKERLTPVLASAQAVNTSLYTQSSVKVLKSVIETATAVQSDGTVSEAQIMSAYSELNRTIKELVDKNAVAEKEKSPFTILTIIIASIAVIVIVVVQWYIRKKHKNKAEKKGKKQD